MQLHLKPPGAAPAAATVPAIPVYVALDGLDVPAARALVKALGASCAHYKVGVAMMEREGALELGKDLKQLGKAVFWDKKLHDTAATMEETVGLAAANGWDLFTVHCKNIYAATSILAGRGNAPMKVLGVTVLTDHTQLHLCDEGLGGHPLPGLVESRARQMEAWGLDGVIASAQEARAIRAGCGSAGQPDLLTRPFLIVTPGIRMQGDAALGQARTATPHQAWVAGADAVVVGRPVTQSADPLGAFLRYAEALQQEPAR